MALHKSNAQFVIPRLSSAFMSTKITNNESISSATNFTITSRSLYSDQHAFKTPIRRIEPRINYLLVKID